MKKKSECELSSTEKFTEREKILNDNNNKSHFSLQGNTFHKKLKIGENVFGQISFICKQLKHVSEIFYFQF